MKRHGITTFYMEALFLIAVFIAVILVLTRVFGAGRSHSQEARILTSAVNLAQNAAEAVSASTCPEDVAALLAADDAEKTGITVDEANGVTARYNQELKPDPDGTLRLEISWEPKETVSGTLVNSQIDVWQEEQRETPVYTIQTAVFLR